MGPIVRILLRYLAAFLIAKGLLDPQIAQTILGDPEVAMAVEVALGALIGVVTEANYFKAKRTGGPT